MNYLTSCPIWTLKRKTKTSNHPIRTKSETRKRSGIEKDLPTGKVVSGVIAQEIENVLPETITVRDNGLLTVKTDAVLWTAVKAIQELSDKVDELTEKLNNCNCE